MTFTRSYRRLLIWYLSLCIVWAILQTAALHYTFGLSWYEAVVDAMITNSVIAIVSYMMLSMMLFYQPRPYVHFGMTIGFALLSVFVMRILLSGISSDDHYLAFFDRSLFMRSLYAWLTIGLMGAASWVWFYIKEQQEANQRKADTEKLAREAELSRLRLQLQPHFLFNSLNSISALAGTKPEEARRMIQQLSDFLRGTLKKDDQQLVTLSEEIEHLKLYLEIEKVRFGHRLKTHIDHQEQALSYKLPSLLLQPIVENAIKFGLYDTTGEIVIRMIARAEDNHLLVRVENPFDPQTSRPKQGTGFGLNSVQRRLYLLYARQDLLTTSQDDTVFTTSIKIPQTI